MIYVRTMTRDQPFVVLHPRTYVRKMQWSNTLCQCHFIPDGVNLSSKGTELIFLNKLSEGHEFIITYWIARFTV